MNDDRRPDGAGPTDPGDIDTGEPIRALAELGQPTTPGFLERVRPKILLLEFLDLVFHFFGQQNGGGGKEP